MLAFQEVTKQIEAQHCRIRSRTHLPFMVNFMLLVPEASVPAVLMCCDSSVPGMMISASDTL